LQNFIVSTKSESKEIVAGQISALNGKFDSKTQCGLVVGGLLRNLTQYWTEWEDVKK
jgi:hypothetical protein